MGERAAPPSEVTAVGGIVFDDDFWATDAMLTEQHRQHEAEQIAKHGSIEAWDAHDAAMCARTREARHLDTLALLMWRRARAWYQGRALLSASAPRRTRARTRERRSHRSTRRTASRSAGGGEDGPSDPPAGPSPRRTFYTFGVTARERWGLQ